MLFAVAILAPLAVFAAALSIKYASLERARGRADAQEAAQRVSSGIDREIEVMTASLEALAASPSLAAGGDLSAFRRQARDVLRRRGFAIELRDRSGQQVFNSLLDEGVALPRSADEVLLETDRRVFATAEPAVSDLFRAAVTNQPLVVVATPVFRDGQVALTLSVSLDPVQLSSTLAEAARPGWTIAVIDRNDRIISRSRNVADYVGRVATDDLRRGTGGQFGTWTGRTLDGIEVLGAYARSPVSGWRVAVGVALQTIYAPLRRLTATVLVAGALTTLLALGLALVVARTISRPIARLADAATRLERGDAVPNVSTGLLEVDEVASALISADAAIGSREAALQASEERFRAAVRAVEGVIWTNDPDGRMVGDQPGWSALTGQSFADYQGYGWSKAVHPEDAAPTVQAWEEAVQGRKPFVFRHRVRRHDGVYRQFAIRAVPVLDGDGQIRSWVGVHTDITEEFESKKRLSAQEAQLRDLNATLARRVEEASAERDRIWRISTELMMVARFDGTMVAHNPAWPVTLGWSDAELQGVSILALVHPDDAASTAEQLGQLAQGRAMLAVQNRYRHKDGSYRWLAWTAVPEVGLVHAIARDVTAEHEAADALRRTEEQLRQSQKMEVVGQLTGGIAHDFNNLLTVVTGHLEMARRRLDTDGDLVRLKRNIASALEGARRAAVLTHRLLAFSRQSALRPETLDLNAVVGEMEELIRRTLGEPIVIGSVLADSLWPVEADVNQLENALLNLCVNARDAMSAGGRLRIETRNVTLDAHAPAVQRGVILAGDYACISVIDSGTGIPEAIRSRVFEPFFTTKPVGQGTGLGLSQVVGFMSQSGGWAEIESVEGVGTTVRLLFPRARRAASKRVSELAVVPAVTGHGGRCLIVEDEEMVLDFAATALEDAGFRVLQAKDGETALRLLEDYSDIRLVFTDIVLTGSLSGLEVAIRARARWPAIKVLYTTGYERGSPVFERAVDSDVITKPFTAPALVAKVNAILAGPGQTAG